MANGKQKNGKQKSENAKPVEAPKAAPPTVNIPEDVCAIDGAVFTAETKANHTHQEFVGLEELVKTSLEAYVAFEKSFAKRFRTGAREKGALENAIAMMEARGASETVLAAMRRELELANIEGAKPRGLAFERRRTLYRIAKLLEKHNAFEASKVRGSMNEKDLAGQDPAKSGSPDTGDGEE